MSSSTGEHKEHENPKLPISSSRFQSHQSAEESKTMFAAQVKDYGDIDSMISVVSDVAVPRLSDIRNDGKRKEQMIIRTHAVSLSPGDCRVLSGKTKELQGPPILPYIPAADCCGVVMELPDNAPSDLPFVVGDRVAVRLNKKNYDAMAEFALVSSTVASKVPSNLSSAEAAALASAAPATLLAEYIQPGERVLVMGAGGGVGSHLCQILRHKGASSVVGVSASPDRLLQQPIACDAAVDYTQRSVFDVDEYRQNPFDVVFDLAGGGYQQLEANVQGNQPLIVKSGSEGGRFITTVPLVGPIYEVHSLWSALNFFLFQVLWKATKSRIWTRRSLPLYTFCMVLDENRDHLTKTLELASSGKVKAVIDTKGPFSFSTDGVRAAFHLQESRHPHGKVIVAIADGK
jgi:NADPH:quinone reductase-like Zn-dependent oxidoreductase